MAILANVVELPADRLGLAPASKGVAGEDGLSVAPQPLWRAEERSPSATEGRLNAAEVLVVDVRYRRPADCFIHYEQEHGLGLPEEHQVGHDHLIELSCKSDLGSGARARKLPGSARGAQLAGSSDQREDGPRDACSEEELSKFGRWPMIQSTMQLQDEVDFLLAAASGEHFECTGQRAVVPCFLGILSFGKLFHRSGSEMIL